MKNRLEKNEIKTKPANCLLSLSSNAMKLSEICLERRKRVCAELRSLVVTECKLRGANLFLLESLLEQVFIIFSESSGESTGERGSCGLSNYV